jgi:non-heme chloroperoxidase
MSKGAVLKVYGGAPHGITDTHKEQLGADLLAFVSGDEGASTSSPTESRVQTTS